MCTKEEITVWQSHLARVANAMQYDPEEPHVQRHQKKLERRAVSGDSSMNGQSHHETCA